MNVLKLTLILPAMLCAVFCFAQPICGFDGVHNARLKEDPFYRKAVSAADANLRQYINAHRTQLEARVTSLNAAPYNIPVVVHVVHTGGAIGSVYNPTDAQITGAINYLNQVYNGTYPGTQGVGDLQLQFVLAQRDPNCNPTNGINRINGSGIANYAAGGVNQSTSGGTNEINVKNLIRWPVADYYNIWIVDKIDGKDGTSGQFIAGFAYLAAGAPASLDGTIMLATQMVAGQKTLPHEIGHAFGLYHPFQGSADNTQCPINSNCNTDNDQVCDTDPITQNLTAGVYDFSCRTGTNSCTGTAYSINTESNYMNYTNCYTLFTAGQKARVLATAVTSNRLSLTTSSGGSPTTAGCTPKIDFEFTEAQTAEATTTTSGCRSYKDYSYNMVIGSDPSAAASALLNIASGTATEGVDFDITTNGNFTAPSKTINFPAGAHVAQPFVIRIYDDAGVDGTENFTLGFTVNSGSGNAVKGDGRINLAVTITDNDLAPVGPSNATKLIGTSAGLIQSPFAGANAKQKSELLYKASELTAAGISAGNIVGLNISLTKNSAAGFVYTGLTIKMGQSTNATAYNGSTEFPIPDAAFTTVYSGDYSTVSGLNSFTFSTPFVWNGTSNVVVVICYDNGAITGANDNCGAYTADALAGQNYIFQSTINCTGSFSSWSGYNTGYKPVIQLVYADPGTQVQTVQNSSRQEYLGPNADVYFYDQVTNKLMARITNTSAFDYGCTQVTVDRSNASAGANAVAFWNNTTANYLLSKTLKVTPATNNPSGTYQVSLYYTQAEINNWQTATGQNVSSIQLVKVGSQISDVTPANPSGGGLVNVVSPVITTLGTNTTLSASFSNGFSGFGAGVAGVLLPVQLLDFNGSLKDKKAALNWTTSSETNSKAFDVERSYDGSSFSRIGTVNAAGNSSTARYYSFTDGALAQENNYYRLKQVDADNKAVYSKVILIRGSATTGNFRVINNPFVNEIDLDFGKLQTGKANIKLLDVAGREIYNATSDASGQSRISIHLAGKNISAGIYLLQVNTDNGQFIRRVIKQ